MRKHILLVILCIAAVMSISVMGTLAYLTDTESAVNTFSVGKVDILLDEANVNDKGELILDEDNKPVERVKANEYCLIPGKTYVKDPMITVVKDSEEAYIRMLVKVDCLKELDAIFASKGVDITTIFEGYAPEVWRYVGQLRDDEANTITYEFRYKTTVEGGTENVALEPLFERFTVPGELTDEELESIQTISITVIGHAIQAAGFVDNEETGETAEELAWKAFDRQVTSNI